MNQLKQYLSQIHLVKRKLRGFNLNQLLLNQQQRHHHQY